MDKRQQRELQRLEKALMESEYEERIPEDELELLESSWQESADMDYDVYNADETDVDLDAYSEEVHRGRGRSVLSAVMTMLAMLLLSGCILLLLKFLGVL